ncbi:MAG: NfeD family protein [Clostridia bacterium]|nr:NfeD family protein [Clostridia bacterium]
MPQFMFWVWLAVIVVATVIELTTWNMTSIWFALAAIVALILSAFRAISWEIQLIVFVILSLAMIVSLRKISRKYLLQRSEGKTNTDTFIGTKAKLLKRTVEGLLGELEINGVIWNATTDDDTEIEAGEFVEIVGIKGNKIIIKKLNK